jgi:hypothetical protein
MPLGKGPVAPSHREAIKGCLRRIEQSNEEFCLRTFNNHTVSLYEWPAGATVEDILRNVNTTQKPPEPKLTATLQALRIALGYAEASSQLGRLRQAWTLLGRNENNQQAAIREAFDADRGFPDYVLVPELPNTDGYGFCNSR